MRRNAKSVTTSPQIIKDLAELTKMNFNMLVKLASWLAAHEKEQRRFRFMVIGKLSRIEAAISILLVDQMARNQFKRHAYNQQDLEKDAKAAEEFISKQAMADGETIVKYIHRQEPEPEKRRDRRRKWHGWEI